MSKVEKRTFSITAEQAAYIDAKVASGGYASGSEVIRESLRASQEHDAVIDQWLIEEVMPTYERWKAGKEKEYTVDEVFGRVKARMEERAKQKAS